MSYNFARNTFRLLTFLVFTVFCTDLFSQWDPYAGVVPSYTDGGTVIVSSGGSGGQVIDNDLQTAWQSGGGNPVLPYGFLSRIDLNILLNLGATGQCSNSGGVNCANATDADLGNSINIPGNGGQAWLAFDLNGTVPLRTISLKCNITDPVEVYVYHPGGDSSLIATIATADNFQWKRYQAIYASVSRIKLFSASAFTVFEIGAMSDYPTEYAIVDLGQQKSIGYIVTRHWANGAAVATSIQLSADGTNWTEVGEVNPNALQTVVTRPSSPVNARYVKVEHSLQETDYAKASIWEIDAYDKNGPYGAFPAPQPQDLTVSDLIGINGIWGWGHDKYYDELGPDEGANLFNNFCTHARSYHNLHWDVTDPDITPDFDNMPGSLALGSWFTWDREYLGWKSAGLKVQVTLKFKASRLPVSVWDDPYNASYNYGYAFAEHFGPTNGNNAVDVFEVGNEPWFYPDTFYNTILSGMLQGAHDADPALKLLPCALQSGDPSKIYGAGSNFIGTRVTEDEAQYLDGLNAHYYSYTFDDDGTRIAVYPEHPESEMRTIVNDIRFRDHNMPGKKIYLSEWGWDSDGAGEGCNFGECVTEQEQAVYAVRGAMMFMRLGIDRLTWYFYGNQSSGNLYSRSGVVSTAPDFIKKKSFNAFEAFTGLLGDTYFLDTLREDNQAWIYVFGDSLGNPTHIAAWRPIEGNDASFIQMDQPLGYEADSSWIIRGNYSTGELIPNPVYRSGALKLNISSAPTIIKLKAVVTTNDAIWEGSISDDWDDPDNWSTGQVPGVNADVVIQNGSTYYPATYSNGNDIEINSLTIENGAQMTLVPGSDLTVNNDLIVDNGTLTVTGFGGSAPEILVKGNWYQENGTFIPGTGKVIAGGGLPQSFSHEATFHDLEISNGSTVELYAPVTVTGILAVKSSGILKSNGELVLESGASLLHGTGTPGGQGQVLGDITVKRNGYNGSLWNYWSSPVTGEDVAVLGNRLFYYNTNRATDPVTVSGLQAGWVHASGTMTLGKGYISQGGGTVSFKGPVSNLNSGPTITVPVTRNAATNVGYGLVGNPFPSAISAQAFMSVNGPDTSFGGNNTITGALYFWDDDGTGGSGYSTADFAVWSGAGSVSGPNHGSIVFDGHIASGQSFFIEKITNGNGTVAFTNNMRSTQNDVFFRNQPVKRCWVSLEKSNDDLYNETLIAFIDNATDSIDLAYDARKLRGNTNIALYTKIGNGNYAIQALPSSNDDRIVALGLDAGVSGTYTLSLKEVENLETSQVVILEDRDLGVFQNLRIAPEYVFTTPAGNIENRFFLHFSPALESDVSDALCDGTKGQLQLFQGGSQTWNYILADERGNLIENGTGFNGQLTFDNLDGGIYTLVLSDQYGYQISESFEVAGVDRVSAEFEIDQNDAEEGRPVQFTNLSSGADQYEWDFGDGTGTTSAENPQHTFQTAGIYEVGLHALNEDCEDDFYKTITVTPATGIVDNGVKPFVKMYGFGEKIYVQIALSTSANANILVYDMLGEKLMQKEVPPQGKYILQPKQVSSNFYIVQVITPEFNRSSKLILF